MNEFISGILSALEGHLLLQSLVAFGLIFIFAKILAPIVIFIITKIASFTETELDDEIIEIAKPPIFGTLIVLGLFFASLIIDFPDDFGTKINPVLISAFIVVWTPAVVRIFKVILNSASKSRKIKAVNPQTLPLFNNIAFILVYAISVYALFDIWGIDMTAWLASAGVLGIAIGFAAKDTLANLISGVFILTDKPYKLGDYIVLDSGERGKVINIGIRSTRILTRGDTEIVIPNAVMGNSKIINETGGPDSRYRVSIDIGVSYDSDIKDVEKILLKIAKEEDIVEKNPEPRVRFRVFGPSSLDLSLLVWVKEPELRGKALDILNRKVLKEFRRENIEIPYPQQDVHLKQ